MNLLIIDDDSISNFVTTRVAESSGIFSEVQIATNGKDALAVFAKACLGTVAVPDVVLVDLNMPVMSGFDFIEALNSLSFPNKERLEIVIHTASEDSLDLQRARTLGINHYLIKSNKPTALQTTIFSLYNTVLEKSQDSKNKDNKPTSVE